MPDGQQPRPALPWLSPATLEAARAVRRPGGLHPRTGETDTRAVREIILAHHPALPLTMISEAVAYILALE